jgi:RimJ/RimL family protein N-acetyltransferase
MTIALHGRPSEPVDDLTPSGSRRLRIRRLRPDEDAIVRELDARLSPGTRYLRFCSPMPALPDSLVRLLVSMDDRRGLSLVAEIDTGDRWEVIGLGSFGAIDNGAVEVGLVVCDEWQGRGVGTILADRVLLSAEDRGFDRFVVHVLSENIPIRRLIRRVGNVVSTTMSGAVSEVTFIRRSPVEAGQTLTY